MIRILKFLWLKRALNKRLVSVKETMDLKKVADVYARYVCAMNNWKVDVGYGRLSMTFCEVAFSFQNGYTKALMDNGFEWQNGLVKKRPITDDLPSGALKLYDEDLIKKTRTEAVRVLKEVLTQYGEMPANIETIANTFKAKLKDKDEVKRKY